MRFPLHRPSLLPCAARFFKRRPSVRAIGSAGARSILECSRQGCETLA
ncbi:hypothetical protein PUN28_001534 [Cardiocondyla obscurior]|uniref:Uncharacterized protein n=1 Tax=Cardiocondyla obscurior TaxID=286306 RepID=A0AAW2H5H3_9HYME